MKINFRCGFIILLTLRYNLALSEAAVALLDNFNNPCLMPCLPITGAKHSGRQSQAELVKRCEAALQQNPEDDQALEQLHRLVAEASSLPRDESLRLKQIIRKYTRHASTTLAPPSEPGEPMIVFGTIRDAKGNPIAGALIYVFHADAKGHYTRDRPMDEPNSRLFGYMKTGADGCYQFRTIRPGGYPQAPIPQHIHMLVTAAGYRDHRCQSTCQLVFADDPRADGGWHKRASRHPVLSVTRPRRRSEMCL
jgi:protocatechuate 3,4-dioxygenase beta subunit